MPFFHHEFVRQAVMQALQGAVSEARVLALLGRLSECGLVSSNQLAKVRSDDITWDSVGALDSPCDSPRCESVQDAQTLSFRVRVSVHAMLSA